MTRIVILAAGKGKRMKSELPKVLTPLKERPIIDYLMQAVAESGADNRPIVVVSPANIEIVKNALKNYNAEYAIQKEQLGTAHAVLQTKDYVAKKTDKVIVINGDHPFIKAETIKKIAEAKGETITMLTTVVENFNAWRRNFYHWGRIRRKNGVIASIIEFKDADEDAKDITEVNPAIYAFNNEWLWKNITKLSDENAQKEYYLTDLIKLAFEQGEKINSISIDPREAMGINSKEELEVAEKLIN